MINRNVFPLLVPLVLATLMAIGIFVYTIKKLAAPSVKTFAAILFSSAAVSFGYLMEIISIGIDQKVLWFKFGYTGFSILSAATFLFVVQYTGRRKKGLLGLLNIVPIVFVLLSWTNEFHYLLWTDIQIVRVGQIDTVGFQPGFFYIAHRIISYGLIVLSINLLVSQFIRSPYLYRSQLAVIMIGISMPWLSDFIYQVYVFVRAASNINVFSLMMVFGILFLGWGVLRYGLLDVKPIANKAVLESMRDGVIVLDNEGLIVDLNPAAKRVLGEYTDKAVGKPISLFLLDWEAIKKSLDKDEVTRVEIQLHDRFFEIRTSLILDWQNVINGRLILLDDVTDRKIVERTLRESEERYRGVVDFLPDGVTLHTEGKLVFANQAFASMLRAQSPGELIGREIMDFIHPDYHQDVIARIQKNLSEGKVTGAIEENMICLDGSVINVEVVGIPVTIQGKNYTQAIHRNITQRKKAEAQLRLQVAALEAAANSILITDRKGAIIWANPAFTQLTGYSRAEIIGQNPRFLKSGIHESSFYETLWKTILGGEVWRGQIQNRHKDGSVYVEDMTITPIKNSVSEITNFIAIKYDVTNRIEREEALRASEALYRTTINALEDAVYVIDEDMRITLYNKTVKDWMNKLGFGANDLLGKNLFDVFPFLDNNVKEEYENVSRTGETLVTQESNLFDETAYYTETRKTPLYINGGNRSLRFVTVVHDRTDQVRQDRVREAIIIFASALRKTINRSEMMSIIVDQVLDLLNGKGALIAMRDTQTEGVFVELARGEWEHMSGIHLSRNESASGEIMKTGELFINNDLRKNPGKFRVDLAGDLYAVGGAPLIALGQTIGVLWVARKRAWEEEDGRILSALADMAANAIHRATLFDQTEQQLERLQALQEVDRAITSTLDLRRILDVLLEKVTNQLNVDAADILLYDQETNMLKFAARYGFLLQSTQQTFIPLGLGFAGKVVLEGEIINVPDISAGLEGLRPLPIIEAEGFKAYYGVPLMARGQIQGVLQIYHRSDFQADQEWIDFLGALAGQAAIAIDNAMLFEGMRRANVDLRMAYDATIEGWALALEYRDQETEGHSRRVVQLTERLAQKMGMAGEDLVNIRRGAILHDIGKMGIPDHILLKTGELSEEERLIMQQHPVYAQKMLSEISFLRPAMDIPYCHHERWDGSGYPQGLKKKEIPLAARIFAVVDVWDALSSNRSYRDAWKKEKIVDYIRSQSRKQFDPKVVKVFLELIRADERL